MTRDIFTLLGIGGLVALFALLALSSLVDMSATSDETWHIMSGLTFLRTGDLRMNSDHPYFPNALVALPLAKDKSFFLPGVKDERFRQAQPDYLSEGTAALNGGVKDRGKHVLPPDATYLPRVIMVCLAAAFLLIYGLLLRHYFGWQVAILAVILLGFSPTFLAHSRLATTDFPPTATIFLATFVLWRTHRTRTLPGYAALLTAFVALSFLAIMSKYTTLLVAPLWLVLTSYSVFTRTSARRLALRIALALTVPLCILALWIGGLHGAYQSRFMTIQETKHDDALLIVEEKAMLAEQGGQWVANLYEHYPLPFAYYIRGVMFNMVFKHIGGHESFFMGKYEDVGPWYYAVAFLVKEPLPFVMGALVLAWWAVARLRHGNHNESFLFLGAIPVFLALLFSLSNVKIGVRHVLPLYPFLALGAAVALNELMTTPLRRIIVYGGALSMLVTAIAVHPQYLSYFNPLAGGSANGYRWLQDSNYDWGQNEIVAKQIVTESDVTIDYEDTELPEPGHYYLIRLSELYGRPRNRDERENKLRELLEAGTIRVIDQTLPTHWVVYYPPIVDRL